MSTAERLKTERMVNEREGLGLEILSKAHDLLEASYSPFVDIGGQKRRSFEYRINHPKTVAGFDLSWPQRELIGTLSVTQELPKELPVNSAGVLHGDATSGSLRVTLRVPLGNPRSAENLLFMLTFQGNAIPEFLHTFSWIPEDKWNEENIFVTVREASEQDLREFLGLINQKRRVSIF